MIFWTLGLDFRVDAGMSYNFGDYCNGMNILCIQEGHEFGGGAGVDAMHEYLCPPQFIC